MKNSQFIIGPKVIVIENFSFLRPNIFGNLVRAFFGLFGGK